MNKKSIIKLSSFVVMLTLFMNVNVQASTRKTNRKNIIKTTSTSSSAPVQTIVTSTFNSTPTKITVNDNLQSALTSGKSLILESGSYSISSITEISNNITVEGVENTIINGNNSGSLSISGLHDVEFKNITFTNLSEIYFKNSTNLKFTNCKFNNFIDNGIVLDTFDNVEFSNCIISKIGSTNVNVTWQGMGMYLVNGTNLKVHDSEISNTYGHAAIFLIGTTNFEIKNNKLHDTFYRGIELYQDGNSGTINNNNIYNSGSINTTNSGVGCNGIFADGNSNEVYIENNTISNVIENAIEGTFKSVKYNTINGTGVDMLNHPTPSGEGIYGKTGQYVGNIIKNSFGPGIKMYSENRVSELTITGNSIYNCIDSKFAININSEIGYSNVKILTNASYDNNYCVFVKKREQKNLIVSKNIVSGLNVLALYVNN
jgi:hypothetical protein